MIEHYKSSTSDEKNGEIFSHIRDQITEKIDQNSNEGTNPLALIHRNPRNLKGYLNLIWEKVADKDTQEAKKVA